MYIFFFLSISFFPLNLFSFFLSLISLVSLFSPCSHLSRFSFLSLSLLCLPTSPSCSALAPILARLVTDHTPMPLPRSQPPEISARLQVDRYE